MLVLTRRAGESIYIGDHIEMLIVDIDALELETRCAIEIRDADGNDVLVRHARSDGGVARIDAGC